MQTVYLSIGTNLGNKLQNLNDGLELLRTHVGETVKVSSVYETEPWGVSNQDNYLNLAIEISTGLFPLQLLQAIHSIENIMGRKRNIKWGSRIIDIDILMYKNLHFSMPDLIIPHPYLCQRNFVVFPLFDIAPNLIHPKFKETVQQIKENLKDKGWIKRIDL